MTHYKLYEDERLGADFWKCTYCGKRVAKEAPTSYEVTLPILIAPDLFKQFLDTGGSPSLVRFTDPKEE